MLSRFILGLGKFFMGEYRCVCVWGGGGGGGGGGPDPLEIRKQRYVSLEILVRTPSRSDWSRWRSVLPSVKYYDWFKHILFDQSLLHVYNIIEVGSDSQP